MTILRNLCHIDQLFVMWVLFINNPVAPEVEIRAWSEELDIEDAFNFADMDSDKKTNTSEAFIVQSELLLELAVMLRDKATAEPEPVEAG